jgi:hypothetical protein
MIYFRARNDQEVLQKQTVGEEIAQKKELVSLTLPSVNQSAKRGTKRMVNCRATKEY